MALISCSECNAQISSNAAACIKCGNPLTAASATPAAPARDNPTLRSPHKKSSKGLKIAGVAIVVIAAIAIFAPKENSDPTGQSRALQEAANSGSGATAAPAAPVAETPPSDACAKDDLQCLGDKGVIAAGIYCKDRIARLAEHDVKWTDGTFDMKFSQFRWADKSAGTITYIGDKAEFQNGFGAYTPVVYECDLAGDGKTVLDARVSEGRLPAR
jgi:hypothetical protein